MIIFDLFIFFAWKFIEKFADNNNLGKISWAQLNKWCKIENATPGYCTVIIFQISKILHYIPKDVFIMLALIDPHGLCIFSWIWHSGTLYVWTWMARIFGNCFDPQKIVLEWENESSKTTV